MGLFKVGQVGVLAGALLAPFVGSGCTKKSDTVQNTSAEDTKWSLNSVFNIEMKASESEKSLKEKLHPLNVIKVEELKHHKNLYQVTIASDFDSKLGPKELQAQIQKLPDVKNSLHTKTYWTDGVGYAEYIFGDEDGLKTLRIDVRKIK